MTPFDRRQFLKYLSGTAVTSSFMESIAKAAAIPAFSRSGTIDDVKHVVFLMQENRAFDHYFGTMRGVRGFGDPHPAMLPSGKSVWHQPNGNGPNGNGFVLPFHPAAGDFGMQYLVDTAHDWNDTHEAWNGGKYDQWIPTKSPQTMAYYTRRDIPFHYALADAFTICDGYHCSFLGATDPNRYHMWTGWVGNDGLGGGPVINNAEAGYGWSTYPERLERAGISWKIYQDSGVGLDGPGFWGWTEDPYIGNYGDNSLLYFHQYQNALPGSPLYERARRGTNIAVPGTSFDALFEPLRKDVRDDKLPQVSWIVAPEAFTEHGNWPANTGAWYVSQVLDALTSNPEVWSKTALFVMYDENDGFFDHVVPPTPPRTAADGASTVDASDEIYAGDADHPSGPYGLGVRVPMIVVSPWSKGGWVNSQIFDHTSLIRFLEQRFGRHHPDLIESNITQWRRTVCGDLTTAFDFSNARAAPVELPDTSSYMPLSHARFPDYVPEPPAHQSLPKQERGLRRARALPYALDVEANVSAHGNALRLEFKNTGGAGACFQVRSTSGDAGPWTFTVERGKSLANTWELGQSHGQYDLSVFGPNGFFRRFRGKVAHNGADLDVDVRLDDCGYAVIVRVSNQAHEARRVRIEDAYSERTFVEVLPRGRTVEKRLSLRPSYGWYDVAVRTDSGDFLRRAAGHLENGEDSASDPAFGSNP
ncbi:MAG TPA: phospholipase C, phosphocholine-specific [Steroidobacteraceae bacterium]|jgi:phospholipase C|nr:phospholipase C, phosphocholine-specific [Steroidobacteraceae bacterium]